MSVCVYLYLYMYMYIMCDRTRGGCMRSISYSFTFFISYSHN